MNPRVSVVLPVLRAGPELDRAFACIAAQTLREIEILIVLNGSDGTTRDRALNLVDADERAGIIELSEPSLARACNAGLAGASAPIVARMDADDTCSPERLARQLAMLESDRGLIACGCHWDVVSPTGSRIATVRPPADPRELSWKLLLGNVLAHGSMLLRRNEALAVGGYDESLTRAQDWDLWLRLAARGGRIGVVPGVLYQHVRDDDGAFCTGDEQAEHSARLMLRAWASLAPGWDDPELARLIARSLREGEPSHDRVELGALMTRSGPTQARLTAWLWHAQRSPNAGAKVREVCQRARLREIGTHLRSMGVPGVFLYGAGAHTEWVLDHAHDFGVRIFGVLDDALAGQVRRGFVVISPTQVPPGACVVLSSDSHEERLWHAAGALRARGVHVVRMYDEGPSPVLTRWAA